jgi:hypothetical protein
LAFILEKCVLFRLHPSRLSWFVGNCCGPTRCRCSRELTCTSSTSWRVLAPKASSLPAPPTASLSSPPNRSFQFQTRKRKQVPPFPTILFRLYKPRGSPESDYFPLIHPQAERTALASIANHFGPSVCLFLACGAWTVLHPAERLLANPWSLGKSGAVSSRYDTISSPTRNGEKSSKALGNEVRDALAKELLQVD